ncbi:MAG: hypothetical protein VX777_08490 [Chlamydiota bacterium]|nr:hypothetical protein [Chlamydiota bacterium]
MERILYETNFQGMHLEVIQNGDEISLQSDRSIIHSRKSLNHPEKIIQPYQQQMIAVLSMIDKPPEKILHLGLGGGCIASYLHQLQPVHQDVIEVSEEIVEISHKYFHLPKSEWINIYIQDASNLQCIHGKKYDFIFLDLCDSNGPIHYFQEEPYLRMLKNHLTQKGWVVANSWSEEHALRRELKTWKKLFQEVDIKGMPGQESVIFAQNKYRYFFY